MNQAADCYLLHGWGFQNSVFTELKHLLPESWNVSTPCLYQMADNAVDGSFDALIEKLLPKINRDTVLVGWSMGGLIAQLVAAKSQHVKQLVLIASAPRLVNTDDWQHTIDGHAYNVLMQDFAVDPGSTLNRFVGLVAKGERHHKQMMLTLLKHCALPEQANVLTVWLQEMLNYDLRCLYSGLDIPVLVVFGEQDALVNEQAFENMTNRQGRHLTLKGCGHAPLISRTKEVADAVRAFCCNYG